MSELSPISANKQMIAISGKNFLEFSKTLKVGDVLQGRVLAVLGDNKYGVAFRGHNVVAESVNKFETGQLIQGQVKDLGAKVVMRLVDSDTLVGVLPKAEFAKVFKHISINPSMAAILKDSSLLLSELSSSDLNVAKLVNEFLSLFELEGKGIESFLRNFLSKKGNKKVTQLMDKLNSLVEKSDLGEKNKTHFKQFVNNLLKNLETQGHINKDISSEGAYSYMQIPFFIKGESNSLDLKIYESKQEDPKKEGLRINLDFELSRLGALTFSINLNEKILDLGVFAEKKPVLDLIKLSSKALIDSLKAMGYSMRSFNSYLFDSAEAKNLDVGPKRDFYSIRRIDTVA